MSAAQSHLENLPRGLQVALALGLVALAAFPFFATDFYAQMVARMMILAIFAMSLDLLQGVTGLVSLGPPPSSGWRATPSPSSARRARRRACGGRCPPRWRHGAGRAGDRLLRGPHPGHLLHHGHHGLRADGVLPVLRQQGLGGSDGLYINSKPAAGLFDLENKRVFYYFTLAMLVLVYAFLRRLLFSPFGRALAGIRVNEHRMRAMGFGTFGYKLAAFTLAGAAGLAGYLWGMQTGFINPELMGFHMSAHAIMMVILGGMGNFAGAIVGAFAFEYLLHEFKDPAIGGFNTGKHWQLWMGLFVAVVVCAARPARLLERAAQGAAR